MKKTNTLKWTLSGLLVAIGILIPLISPVRIMIEPASFTLASHVPIFFAMFLSPSIAASVAIGTTLGFLLAGFPIVITIRAFSHIVFALIGAYLLNKRPQILDGLAKSQLFSLLIGVIHAIAEVAVVAIFYYGGALPEANYTQGFFYAVILLVGAGTVIHSMIDFYIAQLVWNGLGARTEKLKKRLA